MNDFFKADQELWWDEFVEREVYEMRRDFDQTQIDRDVEEFDLDVPF